MESIYDRPVLCHIRELVAAGRIQAMAAYDTDRLARDPRHLLTVVADNHKNKVKTLFVKCDHETETRIGEMILYMKGFASALEWDAIIDRTTRGRQKILSQGLWLNGCTTKYDYIFNKEDRSRRANPETAPVVIRIFESVAAGVSLQELARILTREGIPTPYTYAQRTDGSATWRETTLGNMIRDRTYLGEAIARQYQKVRYRDAAGHKRVRTLRRPPEEQLRLSDGRTEALVSVELWAAANRAIQKRDGRRGRPAKKDSHLLSGVIFCGACGSRMTPCSPRDSRGAVAERRGRRRTYRCLAHRLKGTAKCNRVCGANWVEDLAWDLVQEKVLAPGFLEGERLRLIREDNLTPQVQKDLRAAEIRRRKVENQIRQAIECQLECSEGLVGSVLKEKVSSLSAEANELDAHIRDLRERLDGLAERLRNFDVFMASSETIRLKAADGALSHADKRDIIELMGSRVHAWKDAAGRHVRVTLPIGTRCVNSNRTMTRTN